MVFAVPLPVQALVKAAKAGDAMAATALLAKGNRVFAAARDSGREEGLQRGREEGLQRAHRERLKAARRTLQAIADAQGLRPTPPQLERIAACSDLARLEAWLVKLASSRNLDDALSDEE